MKITPFIGMTLAAALLAGCCTEKHEHHHESKEAKQAKWMAEAKVSQADAQATAMAQVPNGTVKESELEKEHGKLIWSFDIAQPDSKDIMEVNVDAITGQVVSTEREKPEDEAREAAGEKKDKDKD
jgi:uncharacterized membrane protein YkoI